MEHPTDEQPTPPLTAAEGLRLYADLVEAHPDLAPAFIGVTSYDRGTPAAAAFCDGAQDEEVTVQHDKLSRSFGPVVVNLHALTGAFAGEPVPVQAPVVLDLADIIRRSREAESEAAKKAEVRAKRAAEDAWACDCCSTEVASEGDALCAECVDAGCDPASGDECEAAAA